MALVGREDFDGPVGGEVEAVGDAPRVGSGDAAAPTEGSDVWNDGATANVAAQLGEGVCRLGRGSLVDGLAEFALQQAMFSLGHRLLAALCGLLLGLRHEFF